MSTSVPTEPEPIPGHWTAAPGGGSTAGRYAGAYRVDGLSVAVSAGVGLDAAPVWRVVVDERRGDISRHLGELLGTLTLREAVAEADRTYPPPSWVKIA